MSRPNTPVQNTVAPPNTFIPLSPVTTPLPSDVVAALDTLTSNSDRTAQHLSQLSSEHQQLVRPLMDTIEPWRQPLITFFNLAQTTSQEVATLQTNLAAISTQLQNDLRAGLQHAQAENKSAMEIIAQRFTTPKTSFQ